MFPLAVISMVAQPKCSSSYKDFVNSLSGGVHITGSMLCAGTEDVDACTGDSGSPVMMRDDNRRWAAIGIVSFGPTICGSIPGVLTKVQNYLPWISSIIS